MKNKLKSNDGVYKDIIYTLIDAHNNIDRAISKLCLMYNNGTNKCKECPLHAKETFFRDSTCHAADVLDCLEFIALDIKNKMQKEKYIGKTKEAVNND